MYTGHQPAATLQTSHIQHSTTVINYVLHPISYDFHRDVGRVRANFRIPGSGSDFFVNTGAGSGPRSRPGSVPTYDETTDSTLTKIKQTKFISYKIQYK